MAGEGEGEGAAPGDAGGVDDRLGIVRATGAHLGHACEMVAMVGAQVAGVVEGGAGADAGEGVGERRVGGRGVVDIRRGGGAEAEAIGEGGETTGEGGVAGAVVEGQFDPERIAEALQEPASRARCAVLVAGEEGCRDRIVAAAGEADAGGGWLMPRSVGASPMARASGTERASRSSLGTTSVSPGRTAASA